VCESTVLLCDVPTTQRRVLGGQGWSDKTSGRPETPAQNHHGDKENLGSTGVSDHPSLSLYRHGVTDAWSWGWLADSQFNSSSSLFIVMQEGTYYNTT